jgi:hypothetical protein
MPVDRPRTTRHGTVDTPLPCVDNPVSNVDEPAPCVDSPIHNILWLINQTERYILWFWP